MTVFWEGQTVGGGVGGGSVDPGSVCSLKKKLNPADAFFLYKINSFKGDN